MNRIQRTLTMFVGAFAVLLTMSGPALADNDKVRVLTQNLYVGSNLFQILDDTNPVPVVAAQIFSDVQMTDFFSRVEVIADLIAKQRPHLVGLQEVSLLRTECPSGILLGSGDPTPNAMDVFADYEQILLDALAARGLDYEVVASIEDADVELPAVNAPGLLPDCAAPYIDVRLTDFDITLKRGEVAATAIMEKRFAANFPVPTPAGPVTFYRGFTVVDADIGGQAVRFVNTHLEVDGNPYANLFQFAQAYELIETLNGLALSPYGDRALIVAGDFNSSPDKFYADCIDPASGVIVEDGCLSAYGLLMANGYADTWELRDDDEAKPGFTCCQAPLLDNRKSELDRRIDHVWFREPMASGGSLQHLDEVKVKVTGTRKKKDKTVNGLWSSDHAGVLAVLKFEDDDDNDDD